MINGLDTTFLIEAEVVEHPGHDSARRLLDEMLRSGESIGIAPQVLSEFVHIVTDGRRFSSPLQVPEAVARASTWWEAKEVVQVFPTDQATRIFLDWMSKYKLGRKRLLDTQLAATYFSRGITSIVTTNVRDYDVFGCFSIRLP